MVRAEESKKDESRAWKNVPVYALKMKGEDGELEPKTQPPKPEDNMKDVKGLSDIIDKAAGTAIILGYTDPLKPPMMRESLAFKIDNKIEWSGVETLSKKYTDFANTCPFTQIFIVENPEKDVQEYFIRFNKTPHSPRPITVPYERFTETSQEWHRAIRGEDALGRQLSISNDAMELTLKEIQVDKEELSKNKDDGPKLKTLQNAEEAFKTVIDLGKKALESHEKDQRLMKSLDVYVETELLQPIANKPPSAPNASSNDVETRWKSIPVYLVKKVKSEKFEYDTDKKDMNPKGGKGFQDIIDKAGNDSLTVAYILNPKSVNDSIRIPLAIKKKGRMTYKDEKAVAAGEMVARYTLVTIVEGLDESLLTDIEEFLGELPKLQQAHQTAVLNAMKTQNQWLQAMQKPLQTQPDRIELGVKVEENALAEEQKKTSSTGAEGKEAGSAAEDNKKLLKDAGQAIEDLKPVLSLEMRVARVINECDRYAQSGLGRTGQSFLQAKNSEQDSCQTIQNTQHEMTTSMHGGYLRGAKDPAFLLGQVQRSRVKFESFQFVALVPLAGLITYLLHRRYACTRRKNAIKRGGNIKSSVESEKRVLSKDEQCPGHYGSTHLWAVTG